VIFEGRAEFAPQIGIHEPEVLVAFEDDNHAAAEPGEAVGDRREIGPGRARGLGEGAEEPRDRWLDGPAVELHNGGAGFAGGGGEDLHEQRLAEPGGAT
jgi:hypothetical protein